MSLNGEKHKVKQKVLMCLIIQGVLKGCGENEWLVSDTDGFTSGRMNSRCCWIGPAGPKIRSGDNRVKTILCPFGNRTPIFRSPDSLPRRCAAPNEYTYLPCVKNLIWQQGTVCMYVLLLLLLLLHVVYNLNEARRFKINFRFVAYGSCCDVLLRYTVWISDPVLNLVCKCFLGIRFSFMYFVLLLKLALCC